MHLLIPCAAKLLYMQLIWCLSVKETGGGHLCVRRTRAHTSLCVCARVCACMCVLLSSGSIGRSCRGKDMGDQYAGNKQREGQREQIKKAGEIKGTDREDRK